MVAMPKTYLRPISSAVVSQSQTLAAQNTTPVAFLPQMRSFQTSPVTRDIDSAAKFIGAGAATVGVAGSGKCILSCFCKQKTDHEHPHKSHSVTATAAPRFFFRGVGDADSFMRCALAERSSGLWKSCTWGTQTGTWLLIALASGRSEIWRYFACLKIITTSQTDALVITGGGGTRNYCSRRVRRASAANIDISCRQQFEYNVQAGYCIQNSIQTNLSQAHRHVPQPALHVKLKAILLAIWGGRLCV